MTAAAAAGLLAIMLVLPHLLPQTRLAATAGVGLWSAVLLLRACLAVSLVLVAILFVPTTELFTLLTHWCLHAVLPFFATHLGFEGHSLGGAAVLVPALVIAASLLSVAFAAWRGTRAVRRWLQRSSLGPGPASSVIVVGSDVVVAAAGLRSPRVVGSAGALVRLDDAELAAGLEHEWGHVLRRHRFITLGAQLCRAISLPLPGGKRALRALQLHLERDADDYAIRKTGDPLALASAICKAAGASAPAAGPALATLAGNGVPERLRRLIGGSGPVHSRPGTTVARTLATLMAVISLALMAAAPTLANSGIDQLQRATAHHHHALGC